MKEIIFLENELWWSGIVCDGINMPYDKNTSFIIDLCSHKTNNQVNPVLISNKGRYIWCPDGMNLEFDYGIIRISSEGSIFEGIAGNSLKTAFRFVKRIFFMDDNRIPNKELILNPQYNTWIELMYDQSENKILEYAKTLLNNGMPTGVIMIDDNWQEDYGVWQFSAKRFSNPKNMVAELHKLGFKVMLWICPFISPDSFTFRELKKKNYLIKDSDKNIKIVEWWNGYSAVLDFTNPDAAKWFQGNLDYLQSEYNIDGFKFDAGDGEYYSNDDITFRKVTPNEQTELYVEIGEKYDLNEYRACWKSAGRAIVQRLADKHHTWDENGMGAVIPNAIAQSLAGYRFICPDMIGGGEYQSFLNSKEIDEQLFVRYAQCSSMMPMMQFSASPFRLLSDQNAKFCREAALIHKKYGEMIFENIKVCILNFDPVIAPICYYYPDECNSEEKGFMLNSNVLVVPITEKNKFECDIYLPTGKWQDSNGNIFNGGRFIRIETPLDYLPIFFKKTNN